MRNLRVSERTESQRRSRLKKWEHCRFWGVKAFEWCILLMNKVHHLCEIMHFYHYLFCRLFALVRSKKHLFYQIWICPFFCVSCAIKIRDFWDFLPVSCLVPVCFPSPTRQTIIHFPSSRSSKQDLTLLNHLSWKENHMDTPIIPGPDEESLQSGALHLHLPSGTNEHLPVMPTPKPPTGSQEAGDDLAFYEREESTDDELYQEAAPFQMSSPMPALEETGQRVQPEQSPASAKRRPFPLVRIILLASIIIILLAGVLIVSAQTTPAMPAQATQPNRTAGNTPTPVSHSTVATPREGTWIPQQLPAGWTDAGLSTGDALEACRTAATLTDLEMSIDYRSVGTRADHGGTMTAAVFLLTPAEVTRFEQEDVRVINNVLFDQVQQAKLVQALVNPQPQLTQFATQGQQQFAWVDVSFEQWQSKTINGQPSAGLETDPKTNQPRIHHMMVLLLRVPQNANGAMGGIGWLVSGYLLDLPAGQTLDIAQPA
jgi:hypothetical protein